MLASLEWLRALCPLEEPAARIAEALTSRGLTVDSVREAGTDTAIEIDVPANRPDCLGHLGLARELSAAFGAELKRPDIDRPDPVSKLDGLERIEIEAPDLCARYSARIVRGVRVGPSPDWVVRRLETCGLRSLNNVVDASNLVLLELGNPIHFFDLSSLSGATIRVRTARDGETLKTLDEAEHRLDPSMLVIADDSRPVALAGIMGGFATEIGEATTDVLIEAAWFLPDSIRRTRRRLGLATDASHRFERGVDPEAVPAAQALAVRLLESLAGGSAAPGWIDVHPRPHQAVRRVLRVNQIERLLGYAPGARAARTALEALGLRPDDRDEERIEITVPSWRVDLDREADLVEEVARHVGYDRIPTHTAGMPSVDGSARRDELEEPIRDALAHLGFHEAFGYSMIPRDADLPFVAEGSPTPLALTNPIAESLALLRRSVLPGLLQAVDLNHRRGVRDVRLFEVGRVFLPRDGGSFPHEPVHVGLAWSGAAENRHWSSAFREVDLFDMMGAVQHTLDTLGPGVATERGAAELPGLQPGQSVVWRREGRAVAWAGALHPELQRERMHPVILAEVDVAAFGIDSRPPATFRALPRLTPVSRDLALVMTPRISFGEVLACVRSLEAPAPVEFAAVDRYEGPPLSEGESSLTLRMTLHPADRTLTESEIETYRLGVIQALRERLKLSLRDG